MFTRLSVQNFQSIGKASLDLGKITLITGPSDLGKSALFRALKTLSRNNYYSHYLKHGTSKMLITLQDEDNIVIFEKGGSTVYHLNNREYTKVGNSVPEDIEKFLNMTPIQFDTDFSLDFNFLDQFGGAFLLSCSGFETAKVMGKLMNIDLVLSSSKEINRDLLLLNKRKDNLQFEIRNIQEYIDENSYVEERFINLTNILELQEQADKEAQELNTLYDLILSYEAYSSNIETLTSELELIDIDEFDFSFDDLELLSYLLREYASGYKKYKYYSELYSNFDTIDLSQATSLFESVITLSPILKELSDLLETQNFLMTKYSLVAEEDFYVDLHDLSELDLLLQSLNSLYLSLASLTSDYTNVLAEIESISTQFREYLEDHNICPLTKKPFTDSCISSIIPHS